MTSRPFGATGKPGTCWWCGHKLRRKAYSKWGKSDKPPKGKCGYGKHDYTLEGSKCESSVYVKSKDNRSGWECEEGHYRDPVRILLERTYRYDKPGDYGDGFFCGQTCGYRFGVRIAQLGTKLVAKQPEPAPESEPRFGPKPVKKTAKTSESA